MSQIRWRLHKDPWMPADYGDDGRVVYAVRALHEGLASDGQQKLVWDWLMYVTGAGDQWDDMSYRPGPEGDRDTAFAEGKKFVGRQFKKMLHSAVTPKKRDEEPSKTSRRKRI